MIDLAQNEARYIVLLYRRLIRSLDQELLKIGLSYGRYAYLFALYAQDGRSQQDLADSIGTDKAAATRALARLESDGLIRRASDVLDKRVVRVHLTAQGKKLRPQLEQAAEAAIREITRGLSDTQRAAFADLLAAACFME